MVNRKSSYRAGLFAEFISRMYLRLHGYRILQSRYVTGRYTGRAEIDIIARRGNTVVFIEVKNRASDAAGVRAVTFSQSARLRRAAMGYLARHRWVCDARFDIMVVRGMRVKWFKNTV